ncbi:MAG: DNRLRE domain-containing protein [Polyangiaceae bacterium]|nr:DNRLRE domain-containing protein [Polyangiaceae bacterium]
MKGKTFPEVTPRGAVVDWKGSACLAFLLATGLGCGAAVPQVGDSCTGTGVCTQGACVAGRCRENAALPAKPNSSRVVLIPRDLALVTASGDADATELPEAVALGKKSTGRAVLLCRFVSTWRESAEIESAFFLMDVMEGAPAPQEIPVVEVARILTPWTGATTSWGRQPRLGISEVIGPLRAVAGQTLRLDVTPQVRAWANHASDDHGLAFVVDGTDENGVLASTGLTKGSGPHLEVYLR